MKILPKNKAFIPVLISISLLNGCKEQKESPNILWITLEDTSPQFIGCYGNKDVKTPVIDQLAREGVMFTNVFSNGPVCSASRSNLITGVNNEQLGTGNHRSKYPIPDYMAGFPSYLKKAGFFTSNNHKTDYNTCNEEEIITSSWNESNKDAGWEHKNSEQNFFSVFNFMSSHQSRTMTHPWKYYEEFVLNNLDSTEITHENDFIVPPIYRDSKEMRKNLSRVYNSINLTDKEIGLLIKKLEKDGLLNSTIIFIFADHGEAIPRGKTSSIGLSYHVPFIIWFPDKFKHLSPWETGKVCDELISFEDLPPSVLSLAGIEAPQYMTGRPILGKFREEPPPFVYGTRNRIDETPDLVRTITDGRYFYMRVFTPRYPQVHYQKYADISDIVQTIRKDYKNGLLNENQRVLLESREIEYLYNLKEDPWELNNLVEDKDHNEILNQMREELSVRLHENCDIHFLPEFDIRNISDTLSPYDFRVINNDLIINTITAAEQCVSKETTPTTLYHFLENDTPSIRYWAAVGLHNYKDITKLDKSGIKRHLNDEYPPFAIEIASVLWDLYNDTDGLSVLLEYAKSKDPLVALQALQMIQYMDFIPETVLDVLDEIRENRIKEQNGYEYDLSVVSTCEVILFYYKNIPLFYDYMAAWIDTTNFSSTNNNETQ